MDELKALRTRVDMLEGELMYWRELVMNLYACTRPPILLQLQQAADLRLRTARASLQSPGVTEETRDGFQRGWDYQQTG